VTSEDIKLCNLPDHAGSVDPFPFALDGTTFGAGRKVFAEADLCFAFP
jgi:hypothetical protein